MKTFIKLAAGTLLGLAANAALAVVPCEIGAGITGCESIASAPVVFTSGASASNKFITDILTDDVCVASTATEFLGEWSETTNHRIVVCHVDHTKVDTTSWGNGTGTDDPLVVFRKTSVGGSGNGVAPVCDNTVDIAYANFPQTLVAGCPADGSPCSSVNPTTTATGCAQNANGIWGCDQDVTALQDPTVGVSDVAPTELKSAGSSNCGTVKGAFAVVFGIPVTNRLYTALQQAQGIGVSDGCVVDPSDDNLTLGLDVDPVTPGNQTRSNRDIVDTRPQCVPTLSRAQIHSMFLGELISWSKFTVGGSALTATGTRAPQDLTGVAGSAGANRVSFCRRVPTSGTYASFEIYINQNGCVSGASAMKNTSSIFVGAPAVSLQSGSSDIENCLDNINQHNLTAGNLPGTGTGSLNLGGANFSDWAFGMLSTESNGTNGARVDSIADDKHYAFVRLDGVLPRVDNAANGTYPFWMVSTVNCRAGINASSLSLCNRIGNVKPASVVLTYANPETQYAWGQGGALALSGTKNAPACLADADNDGLWETSAPCLPYSKLSNPVVSTTLNNCLVPTYVNAANGAGGTQATVLGPNRDNTTAGDTNNVP